MTIDVGWERHLTSLTMIGHDRRCARTRATFTRYLRLAVVAILASFGCASKAEPPPGEWTPTAPMLAGRSGHRVFVLRNGKVLAAGGEAASGSWMTEQISNAYTNTAEIYDPATGKWSPTAPMASPRGGYMSATLPDGRILVIGSAYTEFRAGSAGTASTTSGVSASCELFDPTTESWSDAGTAIEARLWGKAISLEDGRVLVLGGLSRGGNGPASSTAEIWDPGTKRFSVAAPMKTARYRLAATRLDSGKVLVAGGNDASASTEVYDPKTNTWTMGPSFDVALSGDGFVDTKARGLWFVGDRVERFDGSRWTTMEAPRDAWIGAVGSGLMAVDNAKTHVDLGDGWRESGAAPELGRGYAAAHLADGRVLACGGDGPESAGTSASGVPLRKSSTRCTVFRLR